jgi:hypothetical protein
MAIPEGFDGLDFINIYSKGVTEVGRYYSHFTYAPIEIPGDGHFDSVEGYWYWLTRRDDILRELWGYPAKSVGKALPKVCEVEDFMERICLANDLKLKANPEMMIRFAKTTLPLTHFYVYGSRVVEPQGYEWIIEHLSLRRQQLRQWLQKKQML